MMMMMIDVVYDTFFDMKKRIDWCTIEKHIQKRASCIFCTPHTHTTRIYTYNTPHNIIKCCVFVCYFCCLVWCEKEHYTHTLSKYAEAHPMPHHTNHTHTRGGEERWERKGGKKRHRETHTHFVYTKTHTAHTHTSPKK